MAMTQVLAGAPKPSSGMPIPGKPGWWRDVLRYGFAPGPVALAVAAKLLLAPVVSDESFYLFLVPASLAAAGIGGLGPGLVATALGLLLGLLVFNPHSQFMTADVANAAAFG